MSHGTDDIIDIIDKSELSYPITVKQLEDDHGLKNIQLSEDGQHSIMMIELLSQGDFDRFESESDVREQITPVVKEVLSSRRTGVIGKLKEFLYS